MKRAWKLMWLIGIIALVAVTAFAYIVLVAAPLAELPLPLLAVCVVITAACAVDVASGIFTKRHTTATGFG